MNEENIKSEEDITDENNVENILPDSSAEVSSEELTKDDSVEADVENEIQEEVSAPKDFIDEFAPASIVIPNYDKEKALKKMEKVNLKKKKMNTKKNRKRRRLIKKIVSVTCAVVLALLLLVIAVSVAASVIVRVNTSQFAVESAIKNYGPERLVIGEIRDHEKIGMNRSAEGASMADVLRDNAEIPVTYAFIEQEVDKSTYPEFVSEIATDVIGYYVFGTPYSRVTREEIESVLYKNSSKIKTVTGQELTESDCNKLAKYISKTSLYKELSSSELDKQDATDFTEVTSVLFSFPVLIGLLLALVLVIILIIVACKNYAHKIIGGIILATGLITGVAGFIFKPMYVASTDFVKCIVDAFTTAFNKNSLIYGAVVAVAGLLVLLIGSAMSERDNDDEYEYEEEENEEYIEEIEQVTTAL